jgi:hypothetical protein
MEADEKTLLGPVNGKFKFKQLPDGNVDRNTVICISVVRNFPITRVHPPLNITSAQYIW